MADSPKPANSRPLRILYVEDRLPDMELALNELQRAGITFEVKHVEREEEFGRELDSGTYDLVLSDYRLPGWNGMDALKALKRRNTDIPFILVSGTLGDDLAVECIKAGATDYVLKDKLARLPGVVRRALDEQRIRSARDSAEKALALRVAALHAAANGIIITDSQGQIVWVNQAFCRMTQYSQEEILGKNPRILNSGKQSKAFFENLWKSISAGNVWRGQIINRRKDGSLYTEEETITPVRSADGAIEHFIAIKEDVTEREQLLSELHAAEDELRESEQEYRLLFEANPNPMWVYDTESLKFLAVNLAAIRHYGFSREEFLGMTIKEIRPFEELRKFMTEYEAWDKAEDIDFGVWKHAKKNCTPITVEVRSRAIDFRGLKARLVLAVDISEKLEAERQQRVSAELFASMFHSSPEGITISTFEEGRYLEANPAFSNIVGFDRQELLGNTALALGIWRNKEDRAHLFQQLGHSKSLIGFETEFVHKNGNVRQVQISAAHIEFQGIRCLLGHIRDITDQKMLERQYRQAQRMESVGRLASGVAHDFNNLLMIIGSSAEMLEELKDVEKTSRYIEQIRSATNKAASLTRQLLAFSRQQVLQPKVLELSRIIDDLWKMLPRLMGEDVEMIKAIDPTTGRVSADPGQLEQVIMNLAVNARDAMPKGGKLIIETSNVVVDENYVRRHSTEMKPGPYVVLALTDTGMGMDAATQARIFEPFFTTKEVGKGTGLGLATVYGIVKQSGGFIWVYSEVGHGTTFKVYFPRVDAPVEIPEAAPVAQVQAVGRRTILMAEDEPVLRESVAEYLRAKGYEVLEAGSGPAAVGVCETHPGGIDLLITDAVMPGFGGQQLAKHVSERYPGIRIVYTSGYTDRALDPGVNGPRAIFLQKPFSLQTLGETVRRLLG